jgi:hypothetical protein
MMTRTQFSVRKGGDSGLLSRLGPFQVGAFGSFKYVQFSGFQSGASLGQAAFTADFLFLHLARFGAFGTLEFRDGNIVSTPSLMPSRVRVMNQLGGRCSCLCITIWKATSSGCTEARWTARAQLYELSINGTMSVSSSRVITTKRLWTSTAADAWYLACNLAIGHARAIWRINATRSGPMSPAFTIESYRSWIMSQVC